MCIPKLPGLERALGVMACIAALTRAVAALHADSNGQIANPEKVIAAGFAKFRLSGCEIVTADVPDIVENTAAEVLQRFLAKGGLRAAIVTESKCTSERRFLLGRESHLRAIQELG